jgi:CDP-L-myo-inositol myo-inositolphosphotransferase
LPRHRAAEPEPAVPPCVILAAGRGQRLAIRRSKPLTRVLGLSLAERGILALREAGVRRFVVVLGYRADEIRRHYEWVALRRGVEIRFVATADWELGNGASARSVRDAVGDRRFLLAMADHLLSPELVRRLLAAGDLEDDVLVCVDRDRATLFDPDDATKVRVDGEHLVAISKDLPAWDAADTGLFLCGPRLFGALEQAARRGAFSLTDAVGALAREGRVRAVDVGGARWLDVDTPEALREARRRLLADLTKGSEDGYVSSWLNRRISRRVSGRLVETDVTPNQVTVASFAMSLVGAAFLALGSYAAGLLGALLVQAASICDGCDGEIARLKHLASARGAWLDTVLDRYADAAIAVGVTLGHARTGGDEISTWLLGLFALSGFLLASYVTKEFALRHGSEYPNDRLNRLKRRDLRLFGLFCGALLGEAFTALVLLGLLSHACVLGILYRGWRTDEALP